MATRTRELAIEAVANDAEQRAAAGGTGSDENVNEVQARNGALGPATTFTLSAPAITKKGTGLMLVMVSWSGTDATASDTITVQLGRDATVLSTQTIPVGADAGGTWQFAMQFLDTAPDAAAHTYNATVTSTGNHNLSSAANRGVITVIEQ